jgi:hypothetical protein
MEPFEWMLLGIGLAVGGILGANNKKVMRTAARGYMIVGEKTREWTGNMREDFQDALEEARYDREESEREEDLEEEPEEGRQAHTRKRSASGRSQASGKSRHVGSRNSGEAKTHTGASEAS